VRKQCHFWPAERGYDAWDVERLIELSRGLPVERLPLSSIGEVDTVYWFDGRDELPTVRKVVEHARLISEVDVSHPIILGHDGVASRSVVWDGAGRDVVPATAAPMIVGLFRESTKREYHDGRDGEDDG
jgi:hypothetical protein